MRQAAPPPRGHRSSRRGHARKDVAHHPFGAGEHGLAGALGERLGSSVERVVHSRSTRPLSRAASAYSASPIFTIGTGTSLCAASMAGEVDEQVKTIKSGTASAASVASVTMRRVIKGVGPARSKSCSTLSSSMWKQCCCGSSNSKRGRKRSTSRATVWMKAMERIMSPGQKARDQTSPYPRMALVSRYSCRPSTPYSRPFPERL